MTDIDFSRTTPSLNTSRIIGTSAKSTNQFIVQGDIVAYTASGGVVVCHIDRTTNEVTTQQFFCANSNNSSAYATGSDIVRDSYGYPIDSPLVVGADSSSGSNTDDIPSSPSKLQNKVRSINCIAISPNRKLLALGEIGYSPRILLFSLAPNSSENPIALIHEHSFGISSVVFSPDSKWLCSLGVVNDGYINVWKITTTTLSMGVSLVCSNRCSSVVNRLLWHENMIITLGLRIIKVWKFDHDAKTNVLRGKNVILGNLINSNFIDACVLNDDEILVITNVSQLLLLKLNSDVPKLYSLQGPEEEFGSLDYDSEKVWFGTNDYKITSLKISELKQIETASRSSSPSRRVSLLSPSKELAIPVKPIIKVVNFSTDKLLVLNDDEQIKFINKKSNAEIVLTQSIIKDLGGVSVHSNELLAFSRQGNIKRIDKDLNVKDLLNFKLPSGTILANSMTAVEQFNDKLIIGDKYGGLYISKLGNEEYTTIFQTKAHSSSINEIIAFTFEEIEMICSIGRDRMIQIFRNYQGKYELVETVPIHQGNLLKVIHHEGIIYVCSSDRTISVHSLYKSEDSVQMTHDKVITLKATPITMNILDDELIVSQSDKTVQIYNISEEIEFSRMVRFINSQTNEFIQIENFIKYEQYLIGWASDKSLRVFNYNGGSEISVVWGHSDSIVGLFMHGTKLVSIGSDGCLFTWSLQAPAVTPQRSETETPSPIINKQVSRKILPKSQEKLAPERRSPVRSPERRLPEKPSPLKPAKTLLPPAKIITRRSSTPNLSARLTAASISTPKLQSPLKSISPNKPALSTPVLTKKPPHVVVNEVTSPVDGILNRLEDINKKVNLLSSGDRKIVGDKLVQMLESINQPHHQDMLEKYSDLLVDMVEKKLNMK